MANHCIGRNTHTAVNHFVSFGTTDFYAIQLLYLDLKRSAAFLANCNKPATRTKAWRCSQYLLLDHVSQLHSSDLTIRPATRLYRRRSRHVPLETTACNIALSCSCTVSSLLITWRRSHWGVWPRRGDERRWHRSKGFGNIALEESSLLRLCLSLHLHISGHHHQRHVHEAISGPSLTV